MFEDEQSENHRIGSGSLYIAAVVPNNYVITFAVFQFNSLPGCTYGMFQGDRASVHRVPSDTVEHLFLLFRHLSSLFASLVWIYLSATTVSDHMTSLHTLNPDRESGDRRIEPNQVVASKCHIRGTTHSAQLEGVKLPGMIRCRCRSSTNQSYRH
jgi:hypothetical protein